MVQSRQDIFALFIEESMVNLEKMESAVVHMHSNGISEDATAEVFRYVHTLKGSSSNFKCGGIAACAHVLEELLDIFRHKPGLFKREYIAPLFTSIDVFKSALQELDYAQLSVQGKIPCGLELQEELRTLVAEISDTGQQDKGSNIWVVSVRFSEGHGLDAVQKLPALFRKFLTLGDVTIQCNTNVLVSQDWNEKTVLLTWDLEFGETIEKTSLQKIMTYFSEFFSFNLVQKECIASEGFHVPSAQLASPGGVSESVSKNMVTGTKLVASTSHVPAGVEVLRVSIDKINALSGAVSELMAKQAELEMLFHERLVDKRADSQSWISQQFDTLTRSAFDLQSSIMTLRMVQMDLCFDRFQRLCAEISLSQGKFVRLETNGGDTQVDKFVFEAVVESLMHIIRNAVDHGLEMPQERVAQGKPEQGTVQLNASQNGGFVVIDIIDDGRGIDYKKLDEKYREFHSLDDTVTIDQEMLNDFIFQSGISTRTCASEVSGRGVGMDVVKQNIEKLEGNITILNSGVGTSFKLRVPLTLAVFEGQLVSFDGEQYIIPISSIVETIRLEPSHVSFVLPDKPVYCFRGSSIPIIPIIGNSAAPYFGESNAKNTPKNLIIVSCSDNLYAMVVDEVLGNRQVTMKSLDENFILLPGFSGATILAGGTVVFIIDVIAQMKKSQLQEVVNAVSQHTGL